MDKNNFSDDSKLIEAIIQNDQAAFEEMYYKYYTALYRFVSFRLRSTEIARDMIQELFYKIWTMRTTLDPSKSIKAYLYRSLLNMIINHQNLHSSKVRSLDEINENQSGNERDHGLKIDIDSALKKLPEKCKTVFIMSKYDGFKYSEIASICNISVKAVEKRMSKSLELLKKYLE